ncbi:MAG: helix-turn-helix domain-containing protein [Sphingopyxis sp.]|nr:helix-turn-helix domain-containing protein [Sphingopyxis sp.]
MSAHYAPAHGSRDNLLLLKFRKGEIIYLQGDPATDWFEVVSGTVRTCFLYTDGHRQLTGFHYDGDAFGIDEAFYHSSAEAVTTVTLRRHRNVTKPPVDVDTAPEHGALQRALNSARACIFLLGRRTAAERLAAFLIATSRRTGSDKPLPLPMSRTDIADHLGLTIHTVSRTLSEFVRQNLITFDGPHWIVINDHGALERLASGDGDAAVMSLRRGGASIAPKLELAPQYRS